MTSTGASAPAAFSPRWWVSDDEGRVRVAQPPNPAIAVWLAAVVLAWSGVLSASTEQDVRLVGTGALVVWGLDEVVRGASPFRRVLGALVLGFQLVRLFG